MKKLLAASAGALALSLLGAVHVAASAEGASAAPREIDWLSYYGTEQGVNNWFYCYGAPEKYALMSYGQTTLIPNDHWHGLEYYQYVFSDYMNPGSRTGALRIWVAESDGEISIDGGLCKIWDGGDGVNAAIIKNGETLYSYAFGSDTETVELPEALKAVSVSAGDKIYYYTESGIRYDNGYDGVSFRCEITWNTKGESVLSAAEIRACLDDGLSESYTEVLGVNITDKEYPSGFTVGGNTGSGDLGFWIAAGCLAAGGIGMAAAGTVLLVRGRKKQ